MWEFIAWLGSNWAKITGGFVGTVAAATTYVGLGGPYPASNWHVEEKVALAQTEIIKLRSPLRALQLGQIDGQISRLEGEQDTLLADKARMEIDLPKMTDAIARSIVQQRIKEIDARIKRVTKDIAQLEKAGDELRAIGANAPAQ